MDAENTYYNCESVIAVGEVKSVVTRKELEDSLDKLSIINLSFASDLSRQL